MTKQIFWILLDILILSGCASMFTSNTKATYTTPDGRTVSWESNKEHEQLEFEMLPNGTIRLKVFHSGTPEASTAAALDLSTKMADLLDTVIKSGGKP